MGGSLWKPRIPITAEGDARREKGILYYYSESENTITGLW